MGRIARQRDSGEAFAIEARRSRGVTPKVFALQLPGEACPGRRLSSKVLQIRQAHHQDDHGVARIERRYGIKWNAHRQRRAKA